MRAHSVNSYLIYLALISAGLLTIIGVKTMYDVENIEATFAKAHEQNARNELNRGIDKVLAKTSNLTSTLVNWDETSQQLTDPTYYVFWRDRRIHAVHTIPKYVEGIELYDSSGKLLRDAAEGMPEKVPDIKRYLWFEGGHVWLFSFTPVLTRGGTSREFGYVAIKMDFFMALLELNRFLHLDSSSIRASAIQLVPILVNDIADLIDVQEIHKSDFDDLKAVIYKTLTYFVLLVLFIVFMLYWLVMVLFAKPLRNLDNYIRFSSENGAKLVKVGQDTWFPVTEFNNFAHSIQGYQNKLIQSQDSLQRLNGQLEQRVKDRTVELETVNKELEAFSYSVSHDLRTPLRSLDGYSQALLEDYADSIDERGKEYLYRVRSNAQRMGNLVDDLLSLARISRQAINKTKVNLSRLASEIVENLQSQYPGRTVQTKITNDIELEGDEHLLYVLLENLLQNAWKYSSVVQDAQIEFGQKIQEGKTVLYVKDNGVGFDMRYANKIFNAFERLHGEEFEGTGIGLATVARVLDRHSGKIWVESSPAKGACFYFTLPQSTDEQARCNPT